jgi:2-succinyl-5-enolpyruvyl-6-hydroxy-3-cyclohexene-1-carboxylate synthase
MNQLWGYLIIEELVRNGVDYFVISPGSRSTPLTVAVAQNQRSQKIVCLDERAAAFHAIGYARATGNPAVLICSSGTAAANYLPAVIEAAMDYLPLIILSADRPPELRQTGANQTIDQVNLYGDYPTWKFDLPCPTVGINPNMVLTTIDLAVSRSRQYPGGVVHLNCMFREPLAPIDDKTAIPANLFKWSQSLAPYTQYGGKLMVPTAVEVHSLIDLINSTTKGALVVGKLKSATEIKAVGQLAARLNWPVFPDLQSGLRLGDNFPNLVHYFDQLFLPDHSIEPDQIDTIVQLGTRIISMQWSKWLEKNPPTNYVAIVDNAERYDPNHAVTLRLESDITHICDRLCQDLPQLPRSNWVKALQADSVQVGVRIDQFLTTTQLNEPLVVRTISQLIPRYHGLWVANSMPIRDLDLYGAGTIAGHTPTLSPRIGANRGTSGIEGSIASATGFAVGLKSPVTAIIGDLSSLYDLNSLALLQHNSQPVIVVIINNDGGGIFSFLPIAKSTEIFETYFGTPHGLDFSHAAAMFKVDYYHPQNIDELICDYTKALADHHSVIIEITSDRADNLQVHQDLNLSIQQQFD